MQTAQKNLIYLYCITKTKPNLTNFKDIGVKIYSIYFQGTYAIVSRVCPDEFSEDNLKKKLNDMEWVEKRVRQHERVIEEIMQYTTVLPFKFATVFKAEENAEGLLKERCTDFKKIIANLEGKEEWGLKIYCDLEEFKDTLEKEDERIKKKEEEITSTSKGKAYLLKKKKDELIRDIINEKIAGFTQDSFERLKRTSLETKINKILPKEVTDKKENMVLNAAFLVDKEEVGSFVRVAELLSATYRESGLFFDCTGPWPPYNFCDLPKEEKQNG